MRQNLEGDGGYVAGGDIVFLPKSSRRRKARRIVDQEDVIHGRFVMRAQAIIVAILVMILVMLAINMTRINGVEKDIHEIRVLLFNELSLGKRPQ